MLFDSIVRSPSRMKCSVRAEQFFRRPQTSHPVTRLTFSGGLRKRVQQADCWLFHDFATIRPFVRSEREQCLLLEALCGPSCCSEVVLGLQSQPSTMQITELIAIYKTGTPKRRRDSTCKLLCDEGVRACPFTWLPSRIPVEEFTTGSAQWTVRHDTSQKTCLGRIHLKTTAGRWERPDVDKRTTWLDW